MTSVDDGGLSDGSNAIEPEVAAPAKRQVPVAALVVAVTFALIVVSVVLVAGHHPARPSIGPDGPPPTLQSASGGLQVNEHWHAALGVNDCGKWIPNWVTPTGPSGAPARAGTDVYAGLHSHGDGIIHMEPVAASETGAHATLGLYFRYAGWRLTTSSITFAGVNEKNGNACNGRPGVLRWSVNGVEHRGNPAAYVLHDGDAIELVFTSSAAALPPKTAIPSYRTLLQMLGEIP